MTARRTHPRKLAALSAALAFGLAVPVGPARACGQNPIVGEICAFAGAQCPPSYLPAQGQVLPTTQTQALFSLLGYYFGGNGRTTFALPDLRGRMMVGSVPSPTTSSGRVGLGKLIGNNSATLAISNMPSHGHAVTATATLNFYQGSATFNASPPAAPPTLAPNATVYMTSASASSGTTALKGPYTPAPPGPHSSVAIMPVNIAPPSPSNFDGVTSGTGAGASFSIQTPARALTYCIASGGQYPIRPPNPPPAAQ
jgi:microcystin-dependent protein